jgi:hypothetical protein
VSARVVRSIVRMAGRMSVVFGRQVAGVVSEVSCWKSTTTMFA